MEDPSGIYYLCKLNSVDVTRYYGIHTAKHDGRYVTTRILERDLEILGRAASNHKNLYGWTLISDAPPREVLENNSVDDGSRSLLDNLLENHDHLQPLTLEELALVDIQ